MRKLILIVLSVLILFSGCGIFIPPPRRLKPYNPQRAGATIVQRFNIGRHIGINSLEERQFALAVHNGNLYVYVSGSIRTIFVFDKNTFEKTGEIKVNNITGFGSCHGVSFIITNDGHAFLLCRRSSLDGSRIWSVDMSTGDTILVNNAFELPPDFNFTTRGPVRMSYNKANNTIWLFNVIHLYVFSHDAGAGVFLFNEKRESSSCWLRFTSDGISVFDNSIWFTTHDREHHWGTPINIGIYKFHVDNPEERLHFINVEYLNTLTLPQSALYDPPYIWLMVERNNRVEMLKLLPHTDSTEAEE